MAGSGGGAHEMDESDRQRFGTLLRECRVMAGLTRQELAVQAGLSRRGVAYLESGARRLRPDTVRRLVVALRPGAGARAALERAATGQPSVQPLGAGAGYAIATPLTLLIGREEEQTTVSSLLLQDDVRLLTLTGPGGVGKTRLAIQVASQLGAAFADGVVSVSLAALRDPVRVLVAIGDVVGVPEEGELPFPRRLAVALQPKQVLLLLDNFEHLAGAAPALVELLAACPGLKALVTSRAALRVVCERQLVVGPLGLPADDAPADLHTLAQVPSLALFAARAQAVRPDFKLTAESTPIVAEICRRLDGLPLAIELAATRVKLLAPRALLARLERRLPLLSGGGLDRPPRMRTMRDAIAWSYDLLTPEEQRLFRHLAIFVGGCTLEAIERVASCELRVASSDSQAPSDDEIELLPLRPSPVATHNSQLATLDVVTSLVDKSLLVLEDDEDDEPRLKIHETIREFGLEVLDAHGETDTVRQRHADYFLSLASRAEHEQRAAQQATWLRRLEQEHANLRSALQWLCERGPIEDGLRLGAALWWFWSVRGYLSEGRAWLTALLDQPSAASAGHERARALLGAGVLARIQGDFAQARERLQECHTIARRLGDHAGAADALAELADVADGEGDHRLSRALLDEALAVRRRTDDRLQISITLLRRARVTLRQGDHAATRRALDEARTLAEEIGAQDACAAASFYAGELASNQGNAATAWTQYTVSLASFRELGYQRWIARILEGLAGLAAPELARALVDAAAALREASGQPRTPEEAARLERRLALSSGHHGGIALPETWQRRTLSPDQVIQGVLALDGPPIAAPTPLMGPSTPASPASASPDQRSVSAPERSSGHMAPRLSARQSEVARLIAGGSTNRQIAADLVVGERTAETHVTNILRKLGLTSRSQIVAWVFEHGLLQQHRNGDNPHTPRVIASQRGSGCSRS